MVMVVFLGVYMASHVFLKPASGSEEAFEEEPAQGNEHLYSAVEPLLETLVSKPASAAFPYVVAPNYNQKVVYSSSSAGMLYLGSYFVAGVPVVIGYDEDGKAHLGKSILFTENRQIGENWYDVVFAKLYHGGVIRVAVVTEGLLMGIDFDRKNIFLLRNSGVEVAILRLSPKDITPTTPRDE